MTQKLNDISIKLIVLGALGLIASFVLTLEKIALLQNPAYNPSCSINPLFSCSNVIASPEAAAFGFPNPFIGIAGFSVVITIGFAIIAGAKFNAWFWQGLQAGVLFGIGFVHWLMFETFFDIRALCLYCMLAWIAMIPLFVYVTAYNLENRHIRFKHSKKIGTWLQKHGLKITALWYLLIALVILINFWDFWQTVLS